MPRRTFVQLFAALFGLPLVPKAPQAQSSTDLTYTDSDGTAPAALQALADGTAALIYGA